MNYSQKDNSLFREIYTEARQSYNLLLLGIVLLVATTIFITFVPDVSRLFHFHFESRHMIVGWGAINNYPLQQDLFFFMLAMICLPVICFLCWGIWLIASWLMVLATRTPVTMVLRQVAISLGCWLLLLLSFPYLRDNSLKLMIVPSIIMAATLLSFFIYNRFYFPKRNRSQEKKSIIYHGERLEDIRGPLIRQKNKVMSSRSHEKHIFLILKKALQKRKWFTRILFVYIIFPVVIFLLSTKNTLDGPIDLFHEGESLVPINEVLYGHLPYRDFYVQHGVLFDVYIPLLGYKLFGETLEGVRHIRMYLLPLYYVFFYFLGLSLYRFRFLSSLLLLLLLFQIESDVVNAHRFILVLLSAILLFRAIKILMCYPSISTQNIENKTNTPSRSRNHLYFLSGAGFCTGLAFWWSADVGIYTFIAETCFLILLNISQHNIEIRQRMKIFLFFITGMLSGFLPLFVYFWANNALVDVYHNIHAQIVYNLETWGQPFPSLLILLRPIAERGWINGWSEFQNNLGFRYYLPIIMFLLTEIYIMFVFLSGQLWRSFDDLKLLFIFILGVLFFRSVLGRSDELHLYYGLVFLFILLIVFTDKGLKRMIGIITNRNSHRANRYICASLLPFLFLPIVLTWLYTQKIYSPDNTLITQWHHMISNPFKRGGFPEVIPRAGNIDIPIGQAEIINDVVRFLQNNTQPGEKIFNFSLRGGFLFFARRQSATRYFNIVYASTPDMQREVIEDLKKNNVKYMITRIRDDVDRVPVVLRHPIISKYVNHNYSEIYRVYDTVISKRILDD